MPATYTNTASNKNTIIRRINHLTDGLNRPNLGDTPHEALFPWWVNVLIWLLLTVTIETCFLSPASRQPDGSPMAKPSGYSQSLCGIAKTADDTYRIDADSTEGAYVQLDLDESFDLDNLTISLAGDTAPDQFGFLMGDRLTVTVTTRVAGETEYTAPYTQTLLSADAATQVLPVRPTAEAIDSVRISFPDSKQGDAFTLTGFAFNERIPYTVSFPRFVIVGLLVGLAMLLRPGGLMWCARGRNHRLLATTLVALVTLAAWGLAATVCYMSVTGDMLRFPELAFASFALCLASSLVAITVSLCASGELAVSTLTLTTIGMLVASGTLTFAGTPVYGASMSWLVADSELAVACFVFAWRMGRTMDATKSDGTHSRAHAIRIAALCCGACASAMVVTLDMTMLPILLLAVPAVTVGTGADDVVAGGNSGTRRTRTMRVLAEVGLTTIVFMVSVFVASVIWDGGEWPSVSLSDGTTALLPVVLWPANLTHGFPFVRAYQAGLGLLTKPFAGIVGSMSGSFHGGVLGLFPFTLVGLLSLFHNDTRQGLRDRGMAWLAWLPLLVACLVCVLRCGIELSVTVVYDIALGASVSGVPVTQPIVVDPRYGVSALCVPVVGWLVCVAAIAAGCARMDSLMGSRKPEEDDEPSSTPLGTSAHMGAKCHSLCTLLLVIVTIIIAIACLLVTGGGSSLDVTWPSAWWSAWSWGLGLV